MNRTEEIANHISSKDGILSDMNVEANKESSSKSMSDLKSEKCESKPLLSLEV